MARNQEKHDAVRRSFIIDRVNLKTSAQLHGVPQATAARWKVKAKERGDCWDKARSASRLAQGGIGDLSIQVLEDFTFQYQTLMELLKEDESIKPMDKASILTKLADSYVKITKAAGGGDNQIGRLSVAMETIMLLSDFMRKRYPHQLESFTTVLEQFAPELSKQYS